MTPRPLVLALASTLGLTPACKSGSDEPSVQLEPVTDLVLHASYGELLVAVLTAMRTGDLAGAQASIATPGQIETLCPGFAIAPTPFTETSLPDAVAHCGEVFAPIDQATLDGSLQTHEYGVTHQPQVSAVFEANWKARCPDLTLYELPGIFEVHGEGLPDAGVEINDVFTIDGRWGLMTIPRCRGEGE